MTTQLQIENQGKEAETCIAISDQSTGNVNANPLMVSSSPSHPNQQKFDEIERTPPPTTQQQQQPQPQPTQVIKVSNYYFPLF